MFYSKTWSKEHDILFLREVLVSELLFYRKSSIEPGQIVMSCLNESRIDPNVDERSNLQKETVDLSKANKLEEDWQTAPGIRQMAMETLGETKKSESKKKRVKV